MAFGNFKVFAVAALIALAPMAAMAGKHDRDDDSRRDDRRSSHSILLKKNVITHSIWGISFDRGKSKNSKSKEKKQLVNYGKFFFAQYTPSRDYCPPSETAIPEPSAALLFATGAGVVALRIRGGRR